MGGSNSKVVLVLLAPDGVMLQHHQLLRSDASLHHPPDRWITSRNLKFDVVLAVTGCSCRDTQEAAEFPDQAAASLSDADTDCDDGYYYHCSGVKKGC